MRAVQLLIVAVIVTSVVACTLLILNDQGNNGWQTKWEFQPDEANLQNLKLLDDGRMVFQTTAPPKIYCLYPNGSLCWEYESDEILTISVRSDGWTFFNADSEGNTGGIVALDSNGNVEWAHYEYGDFHEVVIGSNELVIVHRPITVDGKNEILALDYEGDELWRVALEGYHFHDPAFSENGTVLAFSDDGFLNGIDQNGAISWRIPVEIGGNPPIATNQSIYYTSNYVLGGTHAHLFALDVNGDLKWKFPTEEGEEPYIFGPYMGDDGTIYCIYAQTFPGGMDTIYALNLDGTVKWSYQELRLWDLNVSHDSILAMSDSGPVAIDHDGSLDWRIESQGKGCPAQDSEGTVYFLKFDGVVAMTKSPISTSLALIIFVPIILIAATALVLVSRKGGRAS